MLLIVYNITSENVISKLRMKAQEYGEVNHIMPFAFLLDTNVDESSLNKEFMDIVSNNGRIIITRIRRNEINGWFSSDSVDWINSKQF